MSVDVMLPGPTLPRSTRGVLGPQDVPAWMRGGGASARAAASALAGDANVVRQIGDRLRGVLFDAAAALGWQGTAAQQAEAHARAVHGRLATVVTQLDAAQQTLAGLGAVLDAQQPVLDKAIGSWAHAVEPAERLRLLRTWQPAVTCLDAADLRAAEALGAVSAELERVCRTVSRDGWLTDQLGADVGVLPGAGDELHVAVDQASWAQVTGQVAGPAHPAGAQRGWWSGLVDGLIGELGSVTGLTALLGGGAVLAGSQAASQAAGGSVVLAPEVETETGGAMDGNVAPWAYGKAWQAYRDGEPGYGAGLAVGISLPEFLQGLAGERATLPPLIDLTEANFAQRTARYTFSDQGRFAGMTIQDVSDGLRTGRIRPKDVPVDVIYRDGKVLILNTRSSQALTWTGLSRQAWHIVDRTGQPEFEARLTDQLRRNKLGIDGIPAVRITGLPPEVEPPTPRRMG